MDLHIIPESDGAYSIIIYIENFLENTEYNQAINNLKNIEDWKTGDRDGHVINRVQKWYHVDKQPFSKNWRYEWPRWESHYYDNWLLNFQNKVSEKIKEIQGSIDNRHGIYLNPDFNSALFNKYRNGYDAIGSHRDDIAVLGEVNTIACISFGAERTFKMKRVFYNPDNMKSLKRNKKQFHMNMDIKLKPGSLLIMAGSTQKFFSHEIPIEKDVKTERYSITLRSV